MRSSNKRSRSKSNRPRTLGNVVNRVFDSSGPEGKVRGTPQQIIDKYLVLARDAQLSNDRVAAENFLQHAEHYTRMLNEAQREQAREAEARRDSQEAQGQNQQHQGQGQGQGQGQRQDHQPRPQEPRRNGNGNGNDGQQGEGQGRNRIRSGRSDDRPAEQPTPAVAGRSADAAEVIDLEPENEAASSLVETPEARPRRIRREAPNPAQGTAGAEVKPATEAEAATEAQPAAEAEAATPPEAGAESAPAPRRRAPRKPRAPKPAAEEGGPREARNSAAE